MHKYLLFSAIIVFFYGCQPNLDKSIIIEEIRLNDRLFLGKRAQDSLSNIYEKDIKYWIVFNDTIRHFQLDDWTNIEYSENDGGTLIFKDYTAASADGLRVKPWELDGFNSKYLTEKDLQIKDITESSKTEATEKVKYLQDRYSRDFGTFLRSFLMTAYSGMNFDSLMYYGSPIVDDYISRDLGYSRFYNIGIHCESFGYELFDNQIGEIQPAINMLDFFPEREADGGFCEEATTPDGVYYKRGIILQKTFILFLKNLSY